jgi:hypothetical protein
MLFREIVTVYCDNNTEHANTLRGQNSEYQYVKAGGTYSNRLAVNGIVLIYLSTGITSHLPFRKQKTSKSDCFMSDTILNLFNGTNDIVANQQSTPSNKS